MGKRLQSGNLNLCQLRLYADSRRWDTDGNVERSSEALFLGSSFLFGVNPLGKNLFLDLGAGSAVALPGYLDDGLWVCLIASGLNRWRGSGGAWDGCCSVLQEFVSDVVVGLPAELLGFHVGLKLLLQDLSIGSAYAKDDPVAYVAKDAMGNVSGNLVKVLVNQSQVETILPGFRKYRRK